MHQETMTHVKSELNYFNQFLLAMFFFLNFTFFLSVSKPEFPMEYFVMFWGGIMLVSLLTATKKYPFFVFSTALNGLIWIVFYSI